MRKHKEEESYSFELVVQLKDANGNLTGKTKSFKTNKASDLPGIWAKYSKKSSKKQSQSNLPNFKEANEILKNLYTEKETDA